MTTLKAIAFDLDGTLYPEYRILLPSLRIAFRYPRLVYYFNLVRKEIRSVDPRGDFRKTQAEILAKHLKKSVSQTAGLIERVIYEQWLNSIKTMRPYAGLREMIIRLRKAGFKTAVLSDLPLERKLSYLGLEGIWNFARSSEETGYLKPNAAAFRPLIQSLQVTPPEIIYIGNNYRYDVLGARAMGMITGFFSSRWIPGNLADYTFHRFSQVRQFLLSLLPSG
jgi:putative hydrolase of the HAD superfamily